MTFEWDAIKAISNFKKHRVSFEEAITVFDDEHHLITYDRDHSLQSDERFQAIGCVCGEIFRVIVVIFTIREQDLVYRLISARTATNQERRIYEQSI